MQHFVAKKRIPPSLPSSPPLSRNANVFLGSLWEGSTSAFRLRGGEEGREGGEGGSSNVRIFQKNPQVQRKLTENKQKTKNHIIPYKEGFFLQVFLFF